MWLLGSDREGQFAQCLVQCRQLVVFAVPASRHVLVAMAEDLRNGQLLNSCLLQTIGNAVPKRVEALRRPVSFLCRADIESFPIVGEPPAYPVTGTIDVAVGVRKKLLMAIGLDAGDILQKTFFDQGRVDWYFPAGRKRFQAARFIGNADSVDAVLLENIHGAKLGKFSGPCASVQGQQCAPKLERLQPVAVEVLRVEEGAEIGVIKDGALFAGPLGNTQLQTIEHVDGAVTVAHRPQEKAAQSLEPFVEAARCQAAVIRYVHGEQLLDGLARVAALRRVGRQL